MHVFGAYFGLTVARVLYNADHDLSSKQGASYTSDMFSMVGTVFLWMFWPSFNGGAAAISGDALAHVTPEAEDPFLAEALEDAVTPMPPADMSASVA